MNMEGDLRYVSKRDLAAYGGRTKHKQAWAPSGVMGKQIRRRVRAITMVSDMVYVHAGLLPNILDEFASGLTGKEAAEHLNDHVSVEFRKPPSLRGARVETSLLGNEGVLWTRQLSLDPETHACPLLERTLSILGARRMVVGHTPQENGDVTPRCGGRILLADTFMSQAYTRSDAQSAHNEAAVEFYGNSQRVMAIYTQRSESESCHELPSVSGSFHSQESNGWDEGNTSLGLGSINRPKVRSSMPAVIVDADRPLVSSNVRQALVANVLLVTFMIICLYIGVRKARKKKLGKATKPWQA
eukprot:gnl/MRDRNA2_/MRDRNA2_79341_c0_seq3.p1 gnl/MRDRNA2_/MRDRNA2_79341_c0~~gnl/MRDRNA2_/MRDRNA2_79341_c0_seq3.p1  ORF type:complete len:300 (+),score=33.27 gnl/MRDRNA2_/MRDRNA2_79341_c0_seq3:372-1271(+)